MYEQTWYAYIQFEEYKKRELCLLHERNIETSKTAHIMNFCFYAPLIVVIAGMEAVPVTHN